MRELKTGGRQVGTPNKVTSDLRELVANRYPGYNPILSLIDIATSIDNDINIRLQANKEVAKYLCPQLKSIEIKEQAADTKIIVVRVSDDKYKKTKTLIDKL